MEHYPEVSCYFATVRKMLKGFNLVFAKGTWWRINFFIRENNVVQNLLLVLFFNIVSYGLKYFSCRDYSKFAGN